MTLKKINPSCEIAHCWYCSDERELGGYVTHEDKIFHPNCLQQYLRLQQYWRKQECFRFVDNSSYNRIVD